MTQSKNLWVLPTDKPSRLYLTTHEYIFEEGYSLSTDECENKHIYITSDEEIKEGDFGLCSLGTILKFLENGVYNYSLWKKIILTTDLDLIKDGVQAINDDFLEWFVKNPSCEEVDVWINKFYGNKKEMMFNVYGKYKIIIPKEESKTAWVGVLHDKLNEYHPAEYELKDIYQGEGCLPNFPNEELCQIWCDSKYKEEPNYNMKQEILDEMEKQETLEEGFYRIRKSIDYEEFDFTSFELGAKWQQEKHKELFNQETLENVAKELFLNGYECGVESQERSYSEEDMKQFGDWCRNGLLNTEYGFEKLDKHLEQWKQLTKK